MLRDDIDNHNNPTAALPSHAAGASVAEVAVGPGANRLCHRVDTSARPAPVAAHSGNVAVALTAVAFVAHDSDVSTGGNGWILTPTLRFRTLLLSAQNL